MDDIRISTIDIIIKKQKAALKLIGPVEILDLPIQSMVICPSGLSESIWVYLTKNPRVPSGKLT